MIRKSKPKQKNVELLNKFLKVYAKEIGANKQIKPKKK